MPSTPISLLAHNLRTVNPFESASPFGGQASANHCFFSSPELELLRSLPWPPEFGGEERSLCLGDAVAAIAAGGADQGLHDWVAAMGVTVSVTGRTAKIDVSEDSPVMAIYRIHGARHLGPAIRQSSGYVEFEGARVHCIFPL